MELSHATHRRVVERVLHHSVMGATASWHGTCDCGRRKTQLGREQAVYNQTLIRERQALLALELTSLGVDVRRLGFLRWLIDNDQDPEWFGQAEPLRQVGSESLLAA